VVSLSPALAEHMSYATAMAVIAGMIFAGTAVIAALGKEHKGLNFQPVAESLHQGGEIRY
jgi:hypothetical protein